ncbi:hypothetical protein [Methylobacterium frigidaeris]|uniref:Uncharacterized protein n=1 Tax=Methylobacterium frigidaeris TaxID=2038277 RepID=A0AA37HI80_9HYPH|nr:hypothetical protein [Methylobacterium frigidaeris]GJD65625.1 hypothetical protein MPEAHAMD_5820 [Methylobacterium frigidaeris]
MLRTPETFEVFYRKDKPGLRCAVLSDRPNPAFVRGEMWEYGGAVHAGEPVPPGFRLKPVREATRHTGYYLFHVLAD